MKQLCITASVISHLLLLERDVFICEDSPNRMTYQNMLLGTHNFNGTQVVNFIQDWVNTGPLIKIGGNYLRVDSSCPVAITSLDELTCEVCLFADDDLNYAIFAKHLNNTTVLKDVLTASSPGSTFWDYGSSISMN